MKSHIKAVFFDWAGVIVPSAVDKIYNLVEKTYGIADRKFITAQGSYTAMLYEQMELGKMTEEMFWIEFSKNIKKPLPKNWATIFSQSARYSNPRASMKRLNLSLIQKGITTGIISNASTAFANKHYSLGHYKPYLHVFLSHEVGMRKPDKKIYLHALHVVGVKANQSLFIDDRLENVQAAEKLGMHGIHFVNQNQFFKEIKQLGL